MVKPENSSKVGEFLEDAKRFVLINRNTLEMAPLQLYSSALIFAPETSVIRKKYNEYIPDWLGRLPKVQQAWSATLQTLEGHSNKVNSVAFSPDGKHHHSLSMKSLPQLAASCKFHILQLVCLYKVI